MVFPLSCVTDQDQVEGIFDPGGVDEGQDVVLADFGVEMPVELIQRFDMFDPRLAEKSFDLMLPSVFDLSLEEVEDCIMPVGGYLVLYLTDFLPPETLIIRMLLAPLFYLDVTTREISRIRLHPSLLTSLLRLVLHFGSPQLFWVFLALGSGL